MPRPFGRGLWFSFLNYVAPFLFFGSRIHYPNIILFICLIPIHMYYFPFFIVHLLAYGLYLFSHVYRIGCRYINLPITYSLGSRVYGLPMLEGM